MKDEDRVKQLTVEQLAERADRSTYWERIVAYRRAPWTG